MTTEGAPSPTPPLFCGAELDGDLLEYVDIIDTPGGRAGGREAEHRRASVRHAAWRWFVERSDPALAVFDPHKLDVSDEFKRAVRALQGFDDEVKVVLNKADACQPGPHAAPHAGLTRRGSWALPRMCVGNFREGGGVRPTGTADHPQPGPGPGRHWSRGRGGRRRWSRACGTRTPSRSSTSRLSGPRSSSCSPCPAPGQGRGRSASPPPAWAPLRRWPGGAEEARWPNKFAFTTD